MEEFIQIIKDYGAAILSTISVGGVAGAVAIVVKIKKAIDDTKNKVAEMNKEMEDLSLEQLDVLWEEAKQTER